MFRHKFLVLLSLTTGLALLLCKVPKEIWMLCLYFENAIFVIINASNKRCQRFQALQSARKLAGPIGVTHG
ncbi:hypothetical protein EA457_01350 [Streptococcus dysgalactiae subsp. dysgalactiae]|uniref:Uncharacterized protein n=1 Tax=Streptococcus dysgalactiae subsp. dysgalactiae TaxID=99822 RepID=A0A9X7RX59_STRDY|nr:hypothetical protein [Streptococcus dysgalactiae subsp. dysgalactiae]QGG97811.1 hypothetical protein EA459_03625 [Streptococcus dysgalactiae subsp. dysgalactiae]QGH01297.1 hypothetical protein EA457_01350 [Streptococcus dysgalactiae subsp. dysgalactiae]